MWKAQVLKEVTYWIGLFRKSMLRPHIYNDIFILNVRERNRQRKQRGKLSRYLSFFHNHSKWYQTLYDLFIPPPPPPTKKKGGEREMGLLDSPIDWAFEAHYDKFGSWGLNTCFVNYFIFVFTWTHYIILLIEYEFMTHEVWNFMEESETRKAVNGVFELVVSWLA